MPIIMSENDNFYNYREEEDVNDFLEDASVALLENGVTSQLDDPSSSIRKQNYIDAFATSYKVTKDRLENIDEFDLADDQLEELENSKEHFLHHVLISYDKYLGLGLPDFQNKSFDDQIELLDMMYRFFIKDMKKNFTSVVKKYIDESTIIEEQYGLRSDVTTKAYENVLRDRDARIVANMDNIIHDALDAEYSVDEFIDACMNEDATTEALYIKDAFDNMDITGNFVSKYLGYSSDFYSKISTSLRHYIFDKYPNTY